MKKKFLALLTVAVMTFASVIGFVACNDPEEEDPKGGRVTAESLLEKIAATELSAFSLNTTLSGSATYKNYNEETNKLDTVKDDFNFSLKAHAAGENLDAYFLGKTEDDEILGMAFVRGADFYGVSSEGYTWTDLGLEEGDFAGYLEKFKEEDGLSIGKGALAELFPMEYMEFVEPRIMSYALRLYLNLCTFGNGTVTEKEGDAYYLTCKPFDAAQALAKEVSNVLKLVNTSSTLTSLVTSKPVVNILDKLFAGISAKDLYNYIMRFVSIDVTSENLLGMLAPQSESVSKYFKDVLTSKDFYNAVAAESGQSPFPNAKCFGDITIGQILEVSETDENEFNAMLSMIRTMVETLSEGNLFENILQMIPAENNNVKSMNADAEFVFAFDYTSKELTNINVNGDYKVVSVEPVDTEDGAQNCDMTVECCFSLEIALGQCSQFADLTGVNYDDINAGKQPEDRPNYGHSVEGTYWFYSMTMDGETYKVGDEVSGVTLSKDFWVLELKSDGTGVITAKLADVDNKTIEVTWKFNEEGEIEITGNGETMIATLDGDMLILTDPDSDGSITFKKSGEDEEIEKPGQDEPSEDHSVEGTYWFYSMPVEGVEIKAGNELNGITLSKEFFVLKLKSDGTAVMTIKMGDEEMTQEVTWKFDEEDETKIEFTDENGYTAIATCDGDKLIIVVDEDSGTIVTVKKSGDDEEIEKPGQDEPVYDSSIEGTYWFYSVTMNSETYMVGDELGGVTFSKDMYVVELKSDGTGVIIMAKLAGEDDKQKTMFTWKLNEEGKIEITGNGETAIITRDGDKLIIVVDEDSGTIVKVKKSGDDEEIEKPGQDEPVYDSSIEGTYWFYSMTVDGVEIKAGEQMGCIEIPKDMYVLKLKSDGTAVLTVKTGDEEMTQEGTWKLNEEDETKVEITIDGETETATIDGNKLVLGTDGTKITLKK